MCCCPRNTVCATPKLESVSMLVIAIPTPFSIKKFWITFLVKLFFGSLITTLPIWSFFAKLSAAGGSEEWLSLSSSGKRFSIGWDNFKVSKGEIWGTIEESKHTKW